ncbi:hypothetical protein F2Q70_00034640 [Brassica cretica]|uniref:Uncharacterized protein n=1 Tax=Brassica cretica TaxID=69181 RepID=A0A8S9JYY6_BRACR|nr:hypothetical protein F2Q70_00034640 [Brassica cretica]
MEVVSSHLELYWRSYGRFTRDISTPARPDHSGFDHPRAATLPPRGRPSVGWPTRVGRPAADPARVRQPGLVDPRA